MRKLHKNQLNPRNNQRQISAPFISVFKTVFLIGSLAFSAAKVEALGAKQPFTLAEEIGIGQFGDPGDEGRVGDIMWSPDHMLVAVHVGRGLAARNLVESEIRVYSRESLERYSKDGSPAVQPSPLWVLRFAPYKEGPAVQRLRWCKNSKSFAFLLMQADGTRRLYMADVNTRDIKALSSVGLDVTGYDVPDVHKYVYAASTPAVTMDVSVPSRVLTGISLWDILFENAAPRYADRSSLWVGADGNSSPVIDQRSGKAITLFIAGWSHLALRPDGTQVLTELPVREVPANWPTLYRPPSTMPGYALTAGAQNVDGCCSGGRFVNQYALVDVRSGDRKVLDVGPSGDDSAGWSTSIRPRWSPDGKSVVLPAVFPSSLTGNTSPCTSIYSFFDDSVTCLERLDGTGPLLSGNSGERLEDAFVNSRGTALYATFRTDSGRSKIVAYKRKLGKWIANSFSSADDKIELQVRQTFQSPPVLSVRTSHASVWRTIWDPNPQLISMDIGQVVPFGWTDSAGRKWHGGLYRPSNYIVGKRYPLVIQANSFRDEFRPSGIYPTGFAARQLANAGILVLQARCEGVGAGNLEEGPCQAQGFQSAVEALEHEGLVDPQEIGIVGFSRPCYFVLEALTKSGIRFKAASITSGVNEGYWQYLSMVDIPGPQESVSMNGAEPIGPGLEKWLKNAPTFNMIRSKAALQVVGEGKAEIFGMWEPYALMRYMHRPVDLILMNTYEHVLTQPVMRAISQGGTVDWMRFWLQGYEDPDPSKQAQYSRWRRMRSDEFVGHTIDKPATTTSKYSNHN